MAGLPDLDTWLFSASERVLHQKQARAPNLLEIACVVYSEHQLSEMP